LPLDRAGIRKILLPQDNKKDLDEVPNNIKSKLEFVYMENMDEVLEEALLEKENQQLPTDLSVPAMLHEVSYQPGLTNERGPQVHS